MQEKLFPPVGQKNSCQTPLVLSATLRIRKRDSCVSILGIRDSKAQNFWPKVYSQKGLKGAAQGRSK